MLTITPPGPAPAPSATRPERWSMRDLLLHLAAVEQAAVEDFERRWWRLL